MLQDSRVQRVLNNIVVLFSGTILTRLFTMLALFLIARDLGVEGYGRFTATYALLGQALVLLSFGLDTWMLRKGPMDRSSVARDSGNALLIKLLIMVAWLPLVLVLAPLLNPQVYLPALVTAAAIGVAGQAVGMWAQSVFKSQLQNVTTVLVDMLNVTIFFCLTLLLLGKGASSADFAWVRTAGMIAMAGLGLVLVAARFGLTPRRSELPGVARQSLPFLAADGLGVVYATIDVTLLAVILGSGAVGVYVPAIVLVNALFLIPNTVYGVMVPVISRARVSDPHRARLASLAFILGLALLGLLVAAAISLLAGPIIQLVYGADFAASAPVLSIIGIVFFFKSLNFALGGILTAVDWQRERVLAQLVAAAFNIIANLLVIPVYGVLGVAVVYVLTELLLSFGYGFLVWYNSKRSS